MQRSGSQLYSSIFHSMFMQKFKYKDGKNCLEKSYITEDFFL